MVWQRSGGMTNQIKIGKSWLYFGFSFKRFALGFEIDKYHADLDLFFVWVGVEF